MSRKRNSLSQSISSLAASIPDIVSVNTVPPEYAEEQATLASLTTDVDLALGDDDTTTAVAAISSDGGIRVTAVGDHTDHFVEPDEMVAPLDLFTTWSLTPEGHRVRDSRVPTDPVRLGCILDDNARIAFLAGYAAANPSFE